MAGRYGGRMNRLRVLVAGLALSLALASCGGDGDGDDGSGDGGTTGAGDSTGAGTGDKGGGGEVAAGDCKAQLDDVGGVSVMTHCGPASARLTIGGETLEFEGGKCERGDKYLAVNVGRQMLGIADEPVEQHYFGLVAGDVSEAFADGGISIGGESAVPLTGDGTYSGDLLVSWVEGTATGSLTDGELVVSGGVTEGTFSGVDVLGGSGDVEGSFDCG